VYSTFVSNGNVTKVRANFTAAKEIAACDVAYLKMKINSTIGAGDVGSASPGRRHLLETAYLVEILLSSKDVDQSDID
jgi:hypothetical protein